MVSDAGRIIKWKLYSGMLSGARCGKTNRKTSMRSDESRPDASVVGARGLWKKMLSDASRRQGARGGGVALPRCDSMTAS